MEDMLIGIGGAALAGGIYGVVSFFKNKRQSDYTKNFSTTNFVISVVGAAVIGGIASYSGVAPDVISASAMGPLVYQALRKALNGVFPN